MNLKFLFSTFYNLTFNIFIGVLKKNLSLVDFSRIHTFFTLVDDRNWYFFPSTFPGSQLVPEARYKLFFQPRCADHSGSTTGCCMVLLPRGLPLSSALDSVLNPRTGAATAVPQRGSGIKLIYHPVRIPYVEEALTSPSRPFSVGIEQMGMNSGVP